MYTDYFVTDAEDVIIISDLEVPDTDIELLELALLTAMAKGIKTLIIAGDIIATDQQALNDWMQTWAENGEINYEGAVGMVIRILQKYGGWFDEISIISGNHDNRLNKKTGGQVWLGMMLTGTKAKMSHYSYMYIRNSRGVTCVCHPDNFSEDTVVLGKALYNKEAGPDPENNPVNCDTKRRRRG